MWLHRTSTLLVFPCCSVKHPLGLNAYLLLILLSCPQTQHSKLGLAPREQKLLQRLEGRKDEGMPMKRKKKRGPKEPNPLSVKKAGKASKKAKKMASDSVVAAVKSGGVKSGKGGAAPPS